MKVICQFCKSQSNKVEKSEAVRIDEKNFHPKCAQLYKDREELYATICRIFKFKAPGPKNMAYISKFYNQGMTYRGMNFSLIYFYEVKRNDTKKANEGVGIIPYIYEEAKKYYEERKMWQEKEKEQLEKIEQIKDKEKEIRYVKAKKREKINYEFHSEKEFEW